MLCLFVFYHLSSVGLVHSTSDVHHSPHIIHTLTSKPTVRQGFTPVTRHRDVQSHHVPSPKRPLGSHIGHGGHERDSPPPHHINAAGDLGSILLYVFPQFLTLFLPLSLLPYLYFN